MPRGLMPVFTAIVFIAATFLLTQTSSLLDATRGFDVAPTGPTNARPGLLAAVSHGPSKVARATAALPPGEITTHVDSGRVSVPALYR